MKKAIIYLFLVFTFNIVWIGIGLDNAAPWLDIPLHFLGGFFVAMFFWAYYQNELSGDRLKNLVTIVGATLVVGVLWEFFEYGLWQVFLNYAQADVFSIVNTFGHYGDTMFDLVMDMLGAAVYFMVKK